MTNTHNKSFFGQNAALFLRSSSNHDDFIFIQCIKRKSGNNWEKPSKGEGKNIKLSLGEMIMVRKVLTRERDSWSTYHRYNDDSTQISFNWQGKALWVNIGEYAKKLQSPNIEILDLLLEHLVEEKIEFATGGKPKGKSDTSSPSNTRQSSTRSKKKVPADIPEDIMDNFRSEDEIASSMESTPTHQLEKGGRSEGRSKIIVKEEVVQAPQQGSVSSDSSDRERSQEPVDARTIKGIIQRQTAKALLIKFESGTEAWIPKSTIHSTFSPQNKGLQPFLIQSWVLDKKNATT
jgi:hypothetical protein